MTETLIQRGQQLIKGAQHIIDQHGLGDVFYVSGHPTWSFLNMRDARGASAIEIKTLWMQELLERGILSVGTHNISFAHSEADIQRLLDVYSEVLPYIGKTLTDGTLAQALRCKPLVPLFKVR